jgi:hypothetical protein
MHFMNLIFLKKNQSRCSVAFLGDQPLKGQSHEMFRVLFKYDLIDLGQERNRWWFNKILEAPMILD